VLVGTLLFRRQLTSNAFNRKLSGVMVGTAVLVEIERIVAYAADFPVARIFTTDLWISAAAVGVAAITLRPRLWVGVAPSVIGAVLATRFPERAANVFSGAMIVTFLLLGFVLRPARSKR
jgi:hypothetical protein